MPYAPFLATYGTISPLPEPVLEPLALTAPGDYRRVDYNFGPSVVSGAFLFDRWDKGQQIALRANPNHFLGRPNLDAYVIKIVSDATQIVIQLKTGELDVGGITPSLWDDMATATNVRRPSFVGAGWDYYGYNMDPKNPNGRASGTIFGDLATGKLVRQALYHAVDRARIANAVYFKQADVAFSVEPETSWALTSNVPKYEYDLQRAKDMLDQAGWRIGPDGVRTKNGLRLRFEMITGAGAKTRETIMQILAESWRQIGVEATAKPIRFTEYDTTATTRDFDMVIGGIQAGADPDLTDIYQSRVVGHGMNRMGYRNQRVDDLLYKAVQVLDEAKRKPLYGVSKRVQRFGLAPYNRFAARPWLKDVFVTDGR